MFHGFIKNFLFRVNKLGRRADQIWDIADSPILVCVLDVRHSPGYSREQVELIITKHEATAHYSYWGSRKSPPEEALKRLNVPSEKLYARLQSLGITDLRSIDDSSIFDGSWATVVVKDVTKTNIFSHHLIESPQEVITSLLLKLCRSKEQQAEQVAASDR